MSSGFVIQRQVNNTHLYRHVGQRHVTRPVDDRCAEGRLEAGFVEARKCLAGIGRLELGRRQIPGLNRNKITTTTSAACTRGSRKGMSVETKWFKRMGENAV